MMKINNLNQFKKAISSKVFYIEVVEHCYHHECTGQIREITKVQTNAFYSKPIAARGRELNEKDMKWVNANCGKGSYLPYGKSDNWRFEDGLAHYVDRYTTPGLNGQTIVVTNTIATYKLITREEI